MTGTVPGLLASLWQEAGRRVATALDACSVAIVVGDDPAAAGLAALGIALAQAEHRGVTICDAVGDLSPLQGLMPRDTPHGLIDHVFYGVSLTKSAYRIDRTKPLFILPAGAEPFGYDLLFASEPWRALTDRFRATGALLLVVVPALADGMQALAATADGVVTVGDVDGEILPLPVLTTVHVASPAIASEREGVSGPSTEERRGARGSTGGAAGSDTIPTTVGSVQIEEMAPESAPSAPERPVAVNRAGNRVGWAAAALGVLALAGVAWWTSGRNAFRGARAASGVAALTLPRDSAPARADTAPRLAVANPADSAGASAYVVEVMAINSQAAADSQLAHQSATPGFPANTYSPVHLGPEQARWYRLTTGAFRDRAQADFLLASLRARGELGAESGRVLWAPYTLLIRDGVPPSDVPELVRSLRAQGQPVYALLQADGTARLFAGAFVRPSEASLLMSMYPADSARPPLVYRVGRVF